MVATIGKGNDHPTLQRAEFLVHLELDVLDLPESCAGLFGSSSSNGTFLLAHWGYNSLVQSGAASSAAWDV